MRPARLHGMEPHKNIQYQGGPYLPLDGPFTVADEASKFESLLYLLEEHFDPPASLVEVADRARGPLEVVRYECHFLKLSIDLDHRDYTPKPLWVFRSTFLVLE